MTIPPMFDLSGRVALVAGGTRGIGEAFARQYVEHGGRVTISARTAADCERLASALNDEAGEKVAWGHAFDLGDTDSIDALVDAAIGHWGRLDTLFCCSYYVDVLSLDQFDGDAFARTLRLNLVNWTQMAMRARDTLAQSDLASVIFVGSAADVRPHPTNFSYGVSKLGLMRMAQNLAIEWGPLGIRVNTLSPGITRTRDVMKWLPDEVVPELLAHFPLARLAQPEEIAAGGIFLASRAAGFTTGHELVADGGRTLLSGNTGPPFADTRHLGQGRSNR